MKHQEHIFAIPSVNVALADHTEVTTHQIERSEVFIGQRAGLETNAAFRQVLPYILVEHEGKLLTYQRTKGIGEDRLLGKISVGLGGHIDISDAQYDPNTGVLDWAATFDMAATRELAEEMEPTQDHPAVTILNGSDGLAHFTHANYAIQGGYPTAHTLHNGLASDFLIPHARKIAAETDVELYHLGCPLLYSVDSDEWTTAEDSLIFQGFCTPEEIMEEFDVERWTFILLNNYLNAKAEAGGDLSLREWFMDPSA